MPFKSVKQRKFMFKNMPGLARKWAHKYGSKVGGGKSKAQRKKGG